MWTRDVAGLASIALPAPSSRSICCQQLRSLAGALRQIVSGSAQRSISLTSLTGTPVAAHGCTGQRRGATIRRAGKAVSTTCCRSHPRSRASSTTRRSTGARRRRSWASCRARWVRSEGAGLRDPHGGQVGRGPRHDLGRGRRRRHGVDCARVKDEGRQGASRSAHACRPGAAGRSWRLLRAGVPGAARSLQAAIRHGAKAVLRRIGRGDLTVHGFRSTFRDWAGETTAHPREVIEAALAHRLKDKAEAAYARGDLFVKRRRLMEDWAAFLRRCRARCGPCTTSRPRRRCGSQVVTHPGLLILSDEEQREEVDAALAELVPLVTHYGFQHPARNARQLLFILNARKVGERRSRMAT